MSTSAEGHTSGLMASESAASARKTRIACDNCHGSKVRCTGELSGCQRCARGHKTCHYSESNMGRVPAGGVSKRRKPGTNFNLNPVTATAVHLEQQQRRSWTPGTPSENVHSTGHADDPEHARNPTFPGGQASSMATEDITVSIWDDPSGPSEQNEQQQFVSFLENNGSELDSLGGFDPLMSPLNGLDFTDVDESTFELDEATLQTGLSKLTAPQICHTPSTELHKHTKPAQQEPRLVFQSASLFNTPSPSSTHGNHDLNSKSSLSTSTPSSPAESIRCWTTQLEALFHTSQRAPIQLDRLLHHSSQLLPRTMRSLQSLQSANESSSSASLILILICLTEAITLFEQCVPSVLAGRRAAGSSNLSLRLGDFEVDNRAQQALQIHVVRKELSSMVQVTELIKQTLRRPEWRKASIRTHQLLLEDLRLRTVTLVYQMKQGRVILDVGNMS